MMRSAAGTLLAVGLLAAAIVGLLGSLQRGVSWWAALAVAALVVGAIGAVRDLRDPTSQGPARPASEVPSSEQPLTRLRMISRRLDGSTDSAENFEATLRPILLTVAIRRARDDLDVDLEREPHRGDQVWGARTWQLVSRPAQQAPTLHELADAVHTLDTLGRDT